MRPRRALLVAYLALVVLSALVRPTDSAPEPGQASVVLPDSGVRVASWSLAGDAGGPVILLLHGSPGRGRDLRALAEALPGDLHRHALDLPGFGGSTRAISDYSARAHAEHVAAWMDLHRIERAHLVVHSMGGAVALELAAAAPERVASITMIAAIGVVEMELLGDPTVNHAIHAAQLWTIQALTVATPHFGLLDLSPLNVAYARNFHDTDQRRLRPILAAYAGPMLLVHGESDPLVPVAAAREHHRIVPQSELVVLPTDHFLIFRAAEVAPLAARVSDFLRRVERGEATVRATASAERLRAAEAPFDPADLPPITGPGLLLVGALLALATFISEDLTLIAAGLLVAGGRLAFWPAVFACGLGIWVGDLLLMVLGRTLGRAALVRAPLRWWVRPETVEQASLWYQRHGVKVIFGSRFTPGMRLPMYVAAGILRTSMARLAGLLALASVVWTPLLVGGVAWLGEPAVAALGRAGHGVLLAVLLALALAFVLRRLTPLLTWRGRRLARSWLLRQLRWEYWGPLRFYTPVVLGILRHALRHRSLTVFTAVNPGMPAGGFVGESKWDIHQRFGGDANPHLPATIRLGDGDDDRLARVREFAAVHGWPVVLKPDAGQRGQGVIVARTIDDVAAYLRAGSGVVLAQRHVPGREYGVFYVRHPDAPHGEIFSITDKRLVEVVGDGRSTLERLILADDVALPKAPLHLAVHAHRLADVPAAGERVPLVEVGTHARGSVFLDGSHLVTPALEREIDAISRGFAGGFYFGRFDIRAPSEEALRRGESLMIIELNGVTSEATNIYDPRHSVLFAWRTLYRQWGLAYAIGAANAARGVKVSSPRELVREILRFRRSVRGGHVAVDRPLR